MASYDYTNGKTRINNILSNSMKVVETEGVPKDEHFTFSNAYYSWVTGIFVDIRDSTDLFSNEDKKTVARVIRSFTSEVIEILRSDDNQREIGIRGDCVYAIYSTPQKDDIYEIADMSFYINTLMKMLNKMYREKGFPELEAGIGLGTAQELVVKAGRKDTGFNNKVWIGDAVTKASNLSSKGNRDGYQPIVISNTTYINFIDKLVEKNGDKARGWFKEHNTTENGKFYDATIIKTEFDKWIDTNV